MSANGLTVDYINGWRVWSDLHYPYNFEASSIDELLAYAASPKPLSAMNVLEIGCGDGRVIRQLSPVCKSIVGVDTNGPMIRHLQDSLLERMMHIMEHGGSLNVSYEEMSGTDLKFEDESFDLVLYPWSLHQIADKNAALSEAKRVLVKGGYIVIFGLLPGGEYEQTAEALGLDACPIIDLESSYEKPLAETFGKVVCSYPIGPKPGDKEFGFRFATVEEALSAWFWALENWHEYQTTESDIKNLESRMKDYARENDIFLNICGRAFIAQK